MAGRDDVWSRVRRCTNSSTPLGQFSTGQKRKKEREIKNVSIVYLVWVRLRPDHVWNHCVDVRRLGRALMAPSPLQSSRPAWPLRPHERRCAPKPPPPAWLGRNHTSYDYHTMQFPPWLPAALAEIDFIARMHALGDMPRKSQLFLLGAYCRHSEPKRPPKQRLPAPPRWLSGALQHIPPLDPPACFCTPLVFWLTPARRRTCTGKCSRPAQPH